MNRGREPPKPVYLLLLFYVFIPRPPPLLPVPAPSHVNDTPTKNSGLAAGMAIGVVGDAGVRAIGQQEKLFVGMILILIFAEALGLYGLIVALILSQNTYSCD